MMNFEIDNRPKKVLVFSALNYALLIAVLCLGLVVIYGWHTSNALLIQIMPAFVPMQYNTALCFVWVSLGLFAFAFNRLLLSRVFGCVLSVMAWTTLFQYATHTNIGLDELFMVHDITVQTSHPGRMAPNTALCFALVGLFLLSTSHRATHRLARGRHWLLGAIILGLGGIAAIGYWTEVPTAYGWGRLTKMALHTSLGFIFSGAAILLLAWIREGSTTEDRRWIISLLVLVLGCSVAIFNFNVLLHSQFQQHAQSGPIQSTIAQSTKAQSAKVQSTTAQSKTVQPNAIASSVNGSVHPNILITTPLATKDTVAWIVLVIGLLMALGLAGTVHYFLGNRLIRRQLQTIQRATPTGLIASNTQGEIVYTNPAAEKMFGYGQQEMIGMQIESLVPKDVLGEHTAWRNALQDTQTGRKIGRGNLRGVDKTGREFPLDIRISFMPSDSGIQILSSLTDMSSHKALEEKLRQSNEALMQANQELEQFSYVASHDLQEPLRTIKSYCDFVVDDIAQARYDRVAQDVTFITEAAERQWHLVQSLLDYSRLQKAALTFRVVDLNACLKAVLVELDALVQAVSAQIVMPSTLPELWGDPFLLARAFQNLIQNAIKYQEPGSTPKIVITAEPSTRGKAYYQICIEDNGIGIAEENRSIIFEPFRRLHGVGSAYKGSGIGLATVKNIVSRHSGFIHVESATPQGSRFCLDLRAAKQDAVNLAVTHGEAIHDGSGENDATSKRPATECADH